MKKRTSTSAGKTTCLILLLIVLSPLAHTQGLKQQALLKNETAQTLSQTDKNMREQVKQTLKKNAETLRFMENKGQLDNKNVLYYFEGNNGGVYIEKGRIRFVAYEDIMEKTGNETNKKAIGPQPTMTHRIKSTHTFSLNLTGSNPKPNIKLGDSFRTKYNYFMGADSKDWTTGVTAAKDLTLENIYPGIDLRLYSSSDGSLEFDWLIAAGADYSKVNLHFEGQDNISINKDGSLKVGLRFKDINFHIPESYQVTEKGKVPVSFSFNKANENTIAFATQSKLDARYPLVIDPILSWGTFMDGNITGTNAFDQYLFAIQVDPVEGILYCAGATNINIATNAAPYDANGYLNSISGLPISAGNNADATHAAIVYRMSSSGTDLLDLTLYGPASIATNDKIEAYALSLSPTKVFIGGHTTVAIPTTGTPFDNSLNSEDGFVAVFSRDLGTLSYATYLGSSGADTLGVTSIRAISDNSFVAGMSVVAAVPASAGGGNPDYITTGADLTYAGGSEMYIAKFTSLNTLSWGTYVGGSGDEIFNDLELFADGRVAFCGYGNGSLTEVNSAASNSTNTNNTDGIIGVINTTGTAFNYLDKIGANASGANDAINDVEIVGSTLYWTGYASSGFPTSTGAYDVSHNGGIDAVIGSVDAAGGNGTNGSGNYKASFYGGSGNDMGACIKLVSQTDCSGTTTSFLLVWGTSDGAIPLQNINGESFYDSNGNNGGLDMFFAGFKGDLTGPLTFGTNAGGSSNDYLGATGVPRGANHMWVEGANVYIGTTTHSTVASQVPTYVSGGFDAIKDNGTNDAHTIFSIQFTSLLGTDYGDAPASYGTPSHILDCTHLRIGALLDNEAGSQPSILANGDDILGLDDEDGVSNLPFLTGGVQTFSITVNNILNNTGGNATLYAWIDLNSDGIFSPTELVSTTVTSSISSVNKTLTWTNVTVSGSGASHYLRLRLTTNSLADDGGVTPVDERSTASASNGEVEDYLCAGFNCPNSRTEAACQLQSDINSKYTLWLDSAKATGLCNGVLTNNTPGAPSVCSGGTATVTFTYTSTCAPLITTCTSTFTVTAPAAVSLNCPVNTTAASCLTQTEMNTAYTNWLGTASASGGCNGVLSNNSPGTPSRCTPGTTTVTFTYASTCAPLTTTCSRTFTVPALPALPTMTAPANPAPLACGAALPAASTIPFTNGLSGGCLISGTSNLSTFSAQSPAGACGGTIIETWTATDACGRALAPVSRTITISPAALPTMTALSNTTIACGVSLPAASTRSFTNGLSGGCLISGTSNLSTFSAQSPAGACGGTITETWTATDACGRALVPVSRTITVSPAALPTISNPGPTTVACGAVPASSTQPYTNGLSGGCLISGTSNTSTFSAQSPAGACGGTITETWTSGNDACGRAIASISRVITVSPAALPTISNPGPTTVACGAVPSSSTRSYTNGLSGGCLISGTSNTSTFSAQSPAGACGGTITETWTSGNDACGRAIASISRVITVSPAALPTISNPGPTTVACGAVPSSSTRSYTNGLSGGCLISGTSNTSTFSAQSPAGACGGTIIETWTATDACGRALAPVSRTITVSPAALPTISNPGPTTVACGAVPSSSTRSFTNGLSGGCLISGTSNLSTFSAQSPAGACGGTITETWTATDACGRALVPVSRTITVSPAALPTISNPGPTTVACGAVPASSTQPYTNGLSGGCLISGTSNTSTFSAQSPAGACGGTITETWTSGNDACGRAIASISRVITVSPAALPTISNPGPTTVACGAVPSSSTRSYTNGLSGGCLISGTSNTSTFSAQSPAGACGGAITETWTASDVCGRALASVSRTITVSPAALPTMTPPGNTTRLCGEALPAPSTISFTNGAGTGCAITGTSNPSTLSAQVPAGACGGIVTETWTATDACGRALAPVSRTITVSPAALPTIINPGPTTIACGTVPVSSTQPYTNSLLGGCLISGTSNASTFSAQVPAGACGGIITETWTATDACGRVLAPVSRAITVSPAALSTMTPLANISLSCSATLPLSSTLNFSNSGGTGCLVNGISNLSTLSSQVPPGTCGGIVTETWTATDACNRTLTSVSRTITIADTHGPSITCPPTENINCVINTETTHLIYATATDDCSGIASITYSDVNAPGNCAGNYTITRTWKATDNCGNFSTCDQILNVSDTHAPEITCPTDADIACTESTEPINTGSATANDDCSGIASITYTDDNAPGTCTGEHTITRTWKATDNCGNFSVCDQIIHIRPATAPVFDAVSEITVDCGAATTSSLHYDNNASGECHIFGDVTSTLSAASGACGEDITESWDAIYCNQPLHTERTIHIRPATAPVFDAVSEITVDCGAATTSSLHYDNNASGECHIFGDVTSTLSAASGACGEDITESWDAIYCNQPLHAERTIHIRPATPPVFDAVSEITVDCGAATTSSLHYDNNATGECHIFGDVTSTLSAASGACGEDITESWDAIYCGQPLHAERTIHIRPATPPVFDAVSEITVDCGAATTSSLHYDNNASGECHIFGDVTSTLSAASGACGEDITESWDAIYCNQPLHAERTIHIRPATPPVFDAVSEITVDCGAATTSSLHYDNNATGECHIFGDVTSTLSAASGACGEDITESWDAIYCGQPLHAERTIHIRPATPPVFDAVSEITVDCGAATTSSLHYDNNASGECHIFGDVTSTLSAASGACGEDITESWDAIYCNQPLHAERTIHIRPATPPVFEEVSEITVDCGAATTSSLHYDNNATGECHIFGDVTSTLSAASGACGEDITESWDAIYCNQPLHTERTIHIRPATAPVFDAVSEITVDCGAATTSSLHYDNNASGECHIFGDVTSTLSAASGACGEDITESWDAIYCNQPLHTERTIHIRPATAPVFDAVSEITVDCGAATTSSLHYDNNASGECHIFGDVTSTLSAASGACGEDITESWDAIYCNQPLHAERTIHIRPATPPVFDAVSEITVDCGAATTSSLHYDNNATGECHIFGDVTSTLSAASGACGEDITESWDAIYCNQPLHAERTIHIRPATPPVFEEVSEITVDCGAATTSSLHYDNNASGECHIFGDVTSTLSAASGACGEDITESWDAIYCNQPLHAERTIHIRPATPPVFEEVSEITVDCGAATTSSLHYDNNATGECHIFGDVTSTLSAASGACGEDITESWDAIYCNQPLHTERTIHIRPATPPVFEEVSEITVDCGAATTSSLHYDNNASGECHIFGDVTSTLSAASGACGEDITESWDAIYCNQPLHAERTIHIRPATPPVFDAVSEITVDCGAATTSSLHYDNNATGECHIFGDVTSTLSAASGACGEDITESWDAIYCGQPLHAERTIHIRPATPPVFDAVSEITVDCGAATTSSLHYDNNASGECHIFGDVTSTLSAASGACGEDITESWDAIYCNQPLHAERTIHIRPATPPVFEEVSEITVDCGAATTSSLHYDNNATGECHIFGDVTSTLSAASGACGEDITESWDAIYCNQPLHTERTIHIRPATAPVFDAVSEITVDCGAATTSSLHYDNNASGECHIFGDVTSTLSAASGACGEDITESWDAIYCNQPLHAERTIHIRPATPPVFEEVSEITVDCGAATTSSLHYDNNATGECHIFGDVTSTLSAASGACGEDITESWDAIYCNQPLHTERTIHIRPATAPVFDAVSEITVDCGAATTSSLHYDNNASGECHIFGDVTSTLSAASGACGEDITESWDAIYCNQPLHTERTIHIRPATAPVFDAVSEITVDCGAATTSSLHYDNNASGECHIFGDVTSTLSAASGACGEDITESWDAIYCNQPLHAERTIHIRPATPPVFDAVSEITVDCGAATTSSLHYDNNATGECHIFGDVTSTLSAASGACGEDITESWDAIYCGQPLHAERTIHIRPATPPVFDAVSEITVDCGAATTSSLHYDNNASGECHIFGDVTSTLSAASGACGEDITESWDAIYCNQPLHAERTIHIRPATPPVFDAVSEITVDCGAATTSSLHYDNNASGECHIFGDVTSTLSAASGACGEDITESWDAIYCNQPLHAERTIHIRPATPPVFDAVSEITVDCGAATTSSLHYDNNASGECHIFGDVTSTLSAASGACGEDITESWDAIYCNQPLHTERTIHIRPATAPVFDAVSEITVDCGAATTSSLHYDNNASGECHIFGDVTSTLSAASGACGEDITESWDAIYCNQPLHAERTIHIRPATPPVFDAVSEITVDCGAATTSSLHYDNNATGECHIFGDVTSTLSAASGACGEDITESWDAIYCGQPLHAERTIHIRPATPPVFDAVSEITVDCGAATTSSLHYDNNASGECHIFGDVTSTLSAASGACGEDITESWDAIYCGQPLHAERTIHIRPATPPVFDAVSEITVDCGAATTSSLHYDNNASGECHIFGDVTSTLSAASGACGEDITESWDAIYCNQPLHAERTIHIRPATPPVFDAVSEITVDCGAATTSSLHYDNNATGECHIFGDVTSTLSAASGACGEDITESWDAIYCNQPLHTERTIHIRPATAPVFDAVSEITVDCGAATTSSLHYDNNATGECHIFGDVTSTLSAASGACGEDITESWDAIYCNQPLHTERTIHIRPATAPVFDAVSEITVDCGAATTSSLHYDNNASGECHIFGDVTSTLSAASGACGEDITESWDAIYCNQPLHTERTIHIRPATPPVFEEVSEITVDCGAATTSSLHYDNNATGECHIFGDVTSTLSAASGACGEDITESWDAIYCGQPLHAERTIHIRPATPPVFDAVSEITVDCGAATTSSLHYDNNATGECHIFGDVTSTLSAASGACGEDITESWDAIYCGQPLHAERTIHIRPATPPVFDAVSEITVDCGAATTSSLHYDNNATGECHIFGDVTSTLSAASGACGEDITESWDAIYCNQPLHAERTIHIRPATPPVFDAVSEITVDCGAATTSSLHYDNNATGECHIFGDVTSTLSAASGACGEDITESWDAIYCGQPLHAERTIHIRPATPPVFDAVSEITVDCGAATTSSLHYDNNASGECHIFGDVTSTLSAASGACGEDITESWDAIYCNQPLHAERTIHIRPATPPVFEEVSEITVDCGAATTSSLHYDNNATGECHIFGDVTSTLSAASGACGEDITESWDAIYCGQPIHTERTIHIRPATAPVFEEAGDIYISCGQVTTSSLHYDNNELGECHIFGDVTSTLGEIPDGCSGNVTETWTTTDVCGHELRASRTIHISPATPPVFEEVSEITVDCGAATTSSLHYDNNATGECHIFGDVTSTLSAASGACGEDITESWDAIYCNQPLHTERTIHIRPATAPVFDAVSEITVDCGAATTSSLHYDNNASGECHIFGDVTSTLSAASGACGEDITESWDAIYCGQPLHAERTIHIRPATPPVFDAVSEITVDCGAATTSSLHYDNNATGECHIFGDVTSTLSAASGACGEDITESWDAIYCNQPLHTERTIHIRPATPPVFEEVSEITVDCGAATTSSLHYDNNASGECHIFGDVTSTLSAASGACGEDITESWDAIYCNQPLHTERTIHIRPATAPVFDAVSEITVDCGAATTSSLHYDNNASGECHIFGDVTSTLSAASGACGEDITESWDAIYCGQPLHTERTIHIRPATPPVFDAVSEITVDCGAATTSSLHYDNNATGECHIFGDVTSTLSAASGACGEDITESWDAIYCGQPLHAERTIHIRPATPPVFDAVSEITVDCGAATTSSLHYDNNASGECHIFGDVTSTLSAASGACGEDITESWDAIYCNQPLHAERTIHIRPATPPVFDAVSEITVDCGAATTSSLHYDNNASGECHIFGDVTSTLSAASGACGEDITESWDAIYCNQPLHTERTIHIRPATAPVFDAVSEITVDCGAATTSSLHYDNNATGECHIFGDVTSTLSAASGACGEDITESWDAIYCGQPLHAERTIHIRPATPPVFDAVSEITVDCGAATTSSLHYDNNASGECHIFGDVTSTLSAASGACGEDITESWDAIYCNQPLHAERTIHIRPATPPVFDAVSEITVDCGAATTSSLHYDNNATGECHIFGDVTSTLSAASGACGEDITESWDAIYCNQPLHAERTIHIRPATPPVFEEVSEITVDCGAATTSSLHYDNNASGECHIFGDVTSTLSAASGACGEDITESWDAIYCNQPLHAERTIHIRPATPPVFEEVSEITVDCGAATTSSLHYDNNATGECHIFGDVTSTLSAASGACGEDITESWDAIYCNQPLHTERTIHIRPATPPVFEEVSEITVDCGAATTSSLHYDNNASGECHIFGDVTSTLSAASGACGEDITESWDAIYCNQPLHAERTIHIRPATPPVFDAVSEITVDCGAATTSSLHYDNNATGECHIFGDVTSTLSAASGACGEDITESWDAIYCGQPLHAERTIHIRPATPPVFDAVSEITVDCGAATTSSLHYDNNASGECHIFGDVTSTLSAASGACGEDITESWDAIYCNQPLHAERTIHIRPATPPVFEEVSEITVDCGAATTSSLHYDNNATGECHIFGDVTSTLSAASGACGEDITESWDAIYCNQPLHTERTIHIRPATAPVFDAVSEITVDCGAATTSSLHYDNNASGECHIFGDVTSTLSAASGACGEDITESWDAIYCNQPLHAERTIHIRPAALPTMIAPEDIRVPCDAIPASSTISFTNGLSGNCEIKGISNVSTLTSPTNTCGGTITETWTATDVCGRPLTSVSRTITLYDNTPPTFTRPADITISTDAYCSYNANVVFTGDVTNEKDNCSTDLQATFTDDTVTASCSNPCSGTFACHQACYGTRTITRTWHLVDNCSNKAADQVQIITIRDNTPPTFTRPADITIYWDANCDADVNPVATGDVTDEHDNCSVCINATYTDRLRFSTCRFTVTRTWKLADLCGNMAAPQIQTITVLDNTAPTITCAPDKTIECIGTLGFDAPTASDLCGVAPTITILIADHVVGNVHTRTWQAMDACGNTATCSQNVTVLDIAAPNITCPPSITINCQDSQDPDNTGFASATDDHTLEPAITYTDVIVSGSCSGNYSIQRTWKATDDCNNSSNCIQTITVHDITPPTFSRPADITISTDANCSYNANVAFTGDVTNEYDNCTDNPQATFTDDTVNASCSNPCQGPCVCQGECYGTHIITRTWHLADDCGNHATDQIQKITIKDLAPPTFTRPADITIYWDANCDANVDPAVTGDVTDEHDNCSVCINATYKDKLHFSTCSFVVTRTWKLVDYCGNAAATQVQTITILDNTPPVIACSPDKTIACNEAVVFDAVTASDLCGVTPTISVLIADQVTGNVHTRTWQATDACGNSATCTQSITVNGGTPPSITCPATVNVSCALQVPASNIGSVTTSTGSTVTFVSDVISNQTCANRYTITRTYKATNACGNTATCSQTINVNDVTAPTITCSPNKTIACNGIVTFDAPRASDNCSGIPTVTVLVSDNVSGNTHTRTWKATDACGNSATCSQSVTISGSNLAMGPCSHTDALCNSSCNSRLGSTGSVSAGAISGSSGTVYYSWKNASNVVVATTATKTGLPAGTYTLTVHDNCTTLTCNQTIKQPSVLTMGNCSSTDASCGSSTGSVSAGTVSGGSGTITYEWRNSANAIVATTPAETGLAAGTYTLTVRDNCSTLTCSRTIRSVNSAPSCSITSNTIGSCTSTGGNPNNIYLGYGPQSTTLTARVTGNGTFTYSWTPAANLSCRNCLAPVFTPTAAGNYTFTFTVTNNNGCRSTCSINICVRDIRVPRNTCGNNNSLYICHNISRNNYQTIYMNENDVEYYLRTHPNDRLGSCNQDCGAAKTDEEETPELTTDNSGSGFNIMVYPNPFSSQFHIRIESETNERIDVKVFDILGQLLLTRNGISINEEVQLGSEFASGSYLVEVKQGMNTRVIRLLKAE